MVEQASSSGEETVMIVDENNIEIGSAKRKDVRS